MNTRVVNLDGALSGMALAAVELTVADSVVQLPGIPDGCTQVFISIDGASVRCTLDGTVPSAAKGHLLSNGFTGTWSRDVARAAKFIRSGATSGYVFATVMTR